MYVYNYMAYGKTIGPPNEGNNLIVPRPGGLGTEIIFDLWPGCPGIGTGQPQIIGAG